MKSKRLFAGALALMFVFGGTALPAHFEAFDTAVTASAEDNVTIDGVKYQVYDDHAEVDEAVEDALPAKLVLPSSVNGKPLTVIGQNSLNSCDNLKEVVIPDSVEIIKWGFMECKNLKKVVIGNGVKEITGSTFHSCSSLTDVVFGNNVTKIGTFAFYNCTSLTQIKLPDSVTEVGDNLFTGCVNLKKVELSNNIAELPALAFENCSSLTEVKLPDRLEKIDGSCFYRCTSLKELKLPKGTKELGFEFIGNCTDITVEIPASVDTINDYAFQNAKNVVVKCYDDTPISRYLDEYNKNHKSEPIKVVSLGAAPKLMGDVNNDGKIDIEDAVQVINHVNGVKALNADESERANVDGNSKVDIEDAVAIIAHVNGVKAIE